MAWIAERSEASSLTRSMIFWTAEITVEFASQHTRSAVVTPFGSRPQPGSSRARADRARSRPRVVRRGRINRAAGGRDRRAEEARAATSKAHVREYEYVAVLESPFDQGPLFAHHSSIGIYELGTALALRIAEHALARLAPGGQLILYTGSPVDRRPAPLTRRRLDLIARPAQGFDIALAGVLSDLVTCVPLARSAASARPSLILLDLQMPVMDGETFCDECARDSMLGSIPIVIISSDTAAAVRLAATRGRAYLSKPVPIDRLLVTIESIH